MHPKMQFVCQGMLLAHMEPAVDQHPQVPFCRAAPQPLVFQFVLASGRHSRVPEPVSQKMFAEF